jgi:hypothetical protein
MKKTTEIKIVGFGAFILLLYSVLGIFTSGPIIEAFGNAPIWGKTGIPILIIYNTLFLVYLMYVSYKAELTIDSIIFPLIAWSLGTFLSNLGLDKMSEIPPHHLSPHLFSAFSLGVIFAIGGLAFVTFGKDEVSRKSKS